MQSNFQVKKTTLLFNSLLTDGAPLLSTPDFHRPSSNPYFTLSMLCHLCSVAIKEEIIKNGLIITLDIKNVQLNP